jgi:GNAT superfamily N-acetyltransferase
MDDGRPNASQHLLKTVEKAFEGYVISTNRERLDIDAIHAYLADESYWAKGVSRETVVDSIAGSLPIGVYRDGRQVGFARVVTDGATFGWLADVYVLESERGRGLGKEIVRFVLDHPVIGRLRRLMLATADAHGLYQQHGFEQLGGVERFMVIEVPSPGSIVSAL